MDNKNIFAHNLKYFMEKQKKSRRDISNDLGISYYTVSDWVNGKKYPRMDKVEMLAKYFGVLKSDLIEDKTSIPIATPDNLPSNIMKPAARPIPILGTICAGNGMVTEENYIGQFFMDNSVRADYALRVKGDSMIEAEIYDGDIAFLRKDFGFHSGRIYAVVHGVEDEASLKKVYKDGDRIILQPCNPSYSPIIPDAETVCLVGELVGIYHEVSHELETF